MYAILRDVHKCVPREFLVDDSIECYLLTCYLLGHIDEVMYKCMYAFNWDKVKIVSCG